MCCYYKWHSLLVDILAQVDKLKKNYPAQFSILFSILNVQFQKNSVSIDINFLCPKGGPLNMKNAWWKYRPYQMENDIRLIGIAFFYLSLELNRPPGSCGGSVIYYSTYVFGRLGEASQHSITIHNIYCCLNLFHLPNNLIFWIQYYIPWNLLHFSCHEKKN